jgi:MbtH protein
MSKQLDSNDDLTWIILINDRGEHCLWPACTPIPKGWREVGPEGSADQCAAWVDRQWKAMKPAAGRA